MVADPSGEYVVANRRTPGSIATTREGFGTDGRVPTTTVRGSVKRPCLKWMLKSVCVSNLVRQFNGAEDVLTGPCPADTRPQCKCYDFLRKYRLRKIEHVRGAESIGIRSVVETIFECGAENGLSVVSYGSS